MWSGLSFLAASEAGEAFRRNMRAAVATCAAAITGFTALIFGLVALNAWLVQRFTAVEASLMVGGGLLAVSVVFLITAAYIRRSRKASSALASTAIVAAPIALRLIGGRLDFKAVGMAGVLALGAIVGRQLGRLRV